MMRSGVLRQTKYGWQRVPVLARLIQVSAAEGTLGLGGNWEGTHSMKRLKGQVIYAALWLTGIMALVLASGAPNRWGP